VAAKGTMTAGGCDADFILGCGCLGSDISADGLIEAGTDVTFLVRPARQQNLQATRVAD